MDYVWVPLRFYYIFRERHLDVNALFYQPAPRGTSTPLLLMVKKEIPRLMCHREGNFYCPTKYPFVVLLYCFI